MQIAFHVKNSVQPLNERHGYFQHADAQGDVSCAFANDAVASFISLGQDATAALADTGMRPSDLAASLADAQAEIARLRGALEAALPYVTASADASGLMDDRNVERKLLDLLK